MLICGLIRAYVSFNNERYLQTAVGVFNFLKKKHFLNDELYHNSCNGVVGQRGTLSDYAHIIKACFLLNEATTDKSFLVFGGAGDFFSVVLCQIANSKFLTSHAKKFSILPSVA